MSKTIVAGLVIAALVLGGYLYSSNQKITEVADQSPAAEAMGKTQSSAESTQYLPYTPEVLESAKSTRRVLFFYASWCPTCIPANADFTKNVSQLPSDVTVIRVNYNDGDTDAEEKALAAKYGVTYQHTYVQIDAEGNEVTKWNGGSTEELLAKIK
jgi:thioredoxin 1